MRRLVAGACALMIAQGGHPTAFAEAVPVNLAVAASPGYASDRYAEYFEYAVRSRRSWKDAALAQFTAALLDDDRIAPWLKDAAQLEAALARARAALDARGSVPPPEAFAGPGDLPDLSKYLPAVAGEVVGALGLPDAAGAWAWETLTSRIEAPRAARDGELADLQRDSVSGQAGAIGRRFAETYLGASPGVRAVLRRQFEEPFSGIMPDTSPALYGDHDPQYALRSKLDEVDHLLRSGKADSRELIRLVKELQLEVSGTMAEVRQRLARALEAMRDKPTADYLREARAMDRAERERREAEDGRIRLRLEAARSSFALIAGVLRIAGASKDAATVEAAGSASIELVQAMERLGRAFTSNPEGADLGLSLLVSSTNIVSAIAKLMSLFAGGESIDETILSEVRGLQRQLQAIAREMRVHFARLDEKLDLQFGAVMTHLAHLERGQAEIRADLRELNETTRKISRDLGAFSARFMAVVRSEWRRELDGVVRACLEVPARRGERLSYRAFLDCLDSLERHAASLASEPAVAGEPASAMDDASILARFAQPVSTGAALATFLPEVNFLFEVGTARFGGEGLVSGTRKVNPYEWRRATDAYVELAREYPEFARLLPRDGFATLRSALRPLRDGLASLGTISFGGRQRRGNFAFFEKLLANYRVRLATALGALREQEQLSLETQGGVNLLLPLDKQAYAGRPRIKTEGLSPCPESTSSFKDRLSAPDGIEAMIPPAAAALNRFSVEPQLSVCYTKTLGNEARPQVDRDGVRKHRGRVGFEVRAYFGGRLVLARQVVTPEEREWTVRPTRGCGYLICFDDSEHTSLLNREWLAGAGLRARFAELSTPVPETEAEIARSAAELQAAGEAQLKIRRAQFLEQSAGRLRAADDALGGAKLLLQAFVELGLPASIRKRPSLEHALYGSGAVPSAVFSIDDPRSAAERETASGKALDELQSELLEALDLAQEVEEIPFLSGDAQALGGWEARSRAIAPAKPVHEAFEALRAEAARVAAGEISR